MPGYEIIGRVVAAGSAVTKFKTGDVAGVNVWWTLAARAVPAGDGEENYCEGPVGWTATHNGYMKPQNKDFNTFGGYSTDIMVKKSFVLRTHDALDIKAVASILYVGITTYLPTKPWKVGPGQSGAVVGIGGLGHLAVQIAWAWAQPSRP